MVSITDSKNLLVDWLNKRQSPNVQTNVLRKSATNTKDTGIKLPNSTASTNLKDWTKNKLQQKGIVQPTTTTANTRQQILDNDPNIQKIKQLGLQNNIKYMAAQQNQSRFIGLQNNNLNNNQNKPLTDLAGNVIQENLDAKRKSEFNRILNKPVLEIPTKKSEIENYNKKESERYRTDEQVIKDFHYDVRNSNGTLTKEQISQLYPEFQGKEDIALMLQADLLPLVQNDEFADMKKLAEVYPELLPKQKKVGDQILKDQEKQGKEIKDLAKKAEKTLSRYNVLSKNGQQYMEDVYQLGNFVDTIRAEYRLPGNPSDLDIINFGKERLPEVKELLDDMERLKSNYNLTERDRDIILNNGFDIGEWLYQAGADIQNFTQHNQLGDYLDKKSSTWERQLSNLGINGGSANTIANLPKKAVNTAEIPVNMFGSLTSGVGKVGMATERIATQQNRNEDGTTDYNGIVKDVIRGGGGALDVAFNTVMAIPTAIFHLAEETDAGSAVIDSTLGEATRGIDNILNGETLEKVGLSKEDNPLAKRYNDLDEETQADLTNEITVAVFHKGSKVVKDLKERGQLGVDAVNDAFMRAWKDPKWSKSLDSLKENGLIDENLKVTPGNRKAVATAVVKEFTKTFGENLKTNFRMFNTVLKNRRGEMTANMNTLPDNRTFREKSGEKAYNAGVKAREIYDSVKGGVETVKEGVKSINVGNAVKGTSEMAGKGVKATSDLYNAGKNVLSKGKNKITSTVKNTINENIVEPYRKGRGKTNQLNTEGINQGGQVQESNSTLKTDTKINGDNYNQKKTNSKKLNKAQLQLLQTNNRMNPKSIDTFKEWYGTEYGQRMYDRGFTKSAEGGNLKEMENYKNSLLSQKRETLNKIEGTYQDISLQDMADHLVEKAETVKNRKLLKEAKKLRDKHNETGLTMPEADRLRALFTQNVKMGFHQDIPADARERAKNEYLAVKDFLDDIGRKNGFDDLDRINREIQQVQHIIKGVESKMNRQSANNEYTLTDYILMAEAFTSPESAALFTAKQILKHPKVRNAILDKAVGGKKNSQNKITADTRKATNENVENIAKAKRGEKLQSDLSKSDIKGLPYKEGGADNGKNILANGKTIITDGQGNSWVKGQITEIDKRKNKPKDTTPPTEGDTTENKSETPKTESKPKNKVTAKKPVEKKSETKPESKEEVKTETKEQVKEQPKEQVKEQVKEETKTTEEQPKNVVTKKSAVTTKKPATKKNATAKEEVKEVKDIKSVDDLGLNKNEFKNRPGLSDQTERYGKVGNNNVIIRDTGDNEYTLIVGKGGEIKELPQNYHGLKGQTDSYHFQGLTFDELKNNLQKAMNGDHFDGMSTYKGKTITDREGKKQVMVEFGKWEDVPNREGKTKNVVTEKAGVTTKQEPKQEDKSGGNAFGLQKQKGSSRINNFTNVITKIVDKYEGDIKDNSILIEKEPYLPLEIKYNPEKKELIVRHPNLGYDDPAIRFTVDENGKLKPTGIKQAFMEQMMGVWNWTPIKETDGLLHTRAVNLEDQFLGERNIDEDTGVMKEEKSEPEMYDGLPVEQDEGGKFVRKSVEGLPPIKQYIGQGEMKSEGNNVADTLNNLKSFEDLGKIFEFREPTKDENIYPYYHGILNEVPVMVRDTGGSIHIRYGSKGESDSENRPTFRGSKARVDKFDKDYMQQLSELLREVNNNGEILENNRYPSKPQTTTEITGKKTAATEKKVEKAEPKNKITAEEPSQAYNNALLEKKGGLTFSDNNLYSNYRYEFDAGTLSMGGTRVEGKEVKYMGLAEGYTFLKNAIQNAVDNGATIANVINKDTFDYMEVHKGGDHYRIMIKDKNGEPIINSGLGVFLDKNWNDIVNAQSVAKSENVNIIGKNNSLTTKNPINDKGGEKGNGDSEGQKQLSNSEGVLGESEGGRQGVSDKNSTSGGEKTLMSSGDNNKESGSGLTNGGTHKSIRTKGDNVITAKTVTQARDTNRECVNILEKHKYSTNPADYTAEEIETLRQYEGRGGVNDKEDMNTQGALNQYYTKDNIIKAMWRLLDGYNNTDILEPSMGVGRFFMYAPEGSNLAGFEYDKIPGTIAKILYPNADIKIGDFQDNFMLGGKRSVGEYYNGKKYDIVIGNPPYEERQGRQMGLGEEPKISRFDDYFIKRGVDMLKPGGHLAFVTSSQFLRGADNYAKQMISQKADLIDAYRIPIGAFDRTGVETDIIVLERKDGGGDSSLLSASKWFDKHPDKVLGEERNDIKGRFGLKTGVVGDLAEIDNIAQAHLGSDGKPANLEVKFTPNKTEPKVDTEKPKNVVTATKKTAITQKSQPKVKAPKQEIKEGEWTDWTMDKKDDNGNITKVPIGKSYMGVLFKGIPGQETGKLVVGKGGIGKYQNVLNSNGKIGDPSITLESDREGLNYINGELEPNILYATGNIPNKLAQLEADYNAKRIDEQQYNKQKDLLEQALPEPIDFQDIDRNPYSDWVLDTETESLATVWKNSEEGYVDKKQTIRELFKTYISGKDKELGTVSVKKVKKNGDIDFEHQSLATAMIKVLEKQGRGFAKEMEDELTVRMPEEFSKFMKAEIDDTTKQRLQDEFNRKFNNYKNFDYSELGYTIDDVSAKGHWTPSDVQSRGVARILTTESLIVAYGVGQGKTFTGAEGAIASMQQGKATKCLIVVPIGTKSDWMRTIAENNPNQEIVDLGTLAPGSGARERLSAAFGHDPRNWIKPGQIGILVDSALGKQISFKPDTLQFLQEKLTDVTNTPFSRETEVDKLKKQKEELEAENNDYYISNAQLEKNKKKLEKITGELESIESNKVDYGMIVRRYSGKALPDEGISTALDHVYEDYDEYLDNMNKYLDEHEDIDREKALKILNKIYDNERPIYLEELGIDHLTVDEAHNYRNLFNKSVDDDEEGGGGWRASVDISKGSAAAMNLYGMSQYIMEKNNGGNVILLTATPFINEPSEVYNMLSYVGKNGMEEMGIENMDDFFDTYVGLTNKLLIKPSGTDVTNKNVMLQFNNTRALINSLLDRYIDYEGESDLIVKPRQNTYPVRLKMGSRQEEIQKKLEVQIDENNFDDVWQGEPIYVTTKDGDTVTLASTRKVDDKGKTKGAVIEGMGQANSDLISPYLTKYNKDKLSEVTPKELIDTSPKLKAVVEIIKATRQSGINRGVFVYMPIGTELHELLQKAIELENPGIKVGIINGESKYADMTKTQAEKLGLGDPKGARARETGKKFSDGEIDVLIGGENTKEGLNLQGNGYITIEVSQPRNPNDRTQLHGRVWRKGNKSNEVLVIPLLMENSSDIYRFQRMQHKNSRWSLLESLAAYKRGEDIDNLKPQEDMNLEEQKLALFTEPERKAKVSITMDKAELSNQLQKLDGSIQGLEGVLKTMESWGSTRGQYKDYSHNDPYKVLKDETGKDITTNILDENALEPLQQKLDYYHDKAAKSYAEQHPEWNKAQIENAIKKESPYNSDASNYNYTKRFEMAQARGERNAVVRQMNAIGLKSIDELKSYLENLHNEKELLERKIRNIENTKQERIEKYRREIEENKANALDLEDIIEDLKEEFKHQITFKTEGELRDWLKVTENLPKRNVAKSKSDIQHGLNKYSWKSEDYVGIKPKNTEIRKNKVTSQFAQYTDENKKPEFEFNRFVPKQRITKEDGTWLTKIGYQNKLRKGLKDVLRKEKSASIKAEHSGKTMEEELKGDKFYETWISRIMGNITRLAEENAFEIIQAYESDHPELIGDTTPENFLDYVNDYKIENGKEDKIPDKFAIEGAEVLSDKYQEYLDTGEIKEGTKNKVTGNGKNKITNG